MGILEKIAEIEKEISKTQKNKATNYHLGTLKEDKFILIQNKLINIYREWN